MKAHCLMHVPFEGPGYIGDWFASRGAGLKFWKLYEEMAFPRVEDVDFLLVMGGPMNIYEYDRYPWLEPEKNLIGNCIREKKKVLGICLGAQLLADVLGERVFPNSGKEIGWFPVRGRDSLFPGSFLPFHWHGETFNLPAGAVNLASSEICSNQAFSHGNNVLALQFHLEVTPALVEGLLDHVAGDLEPGPFVQGREEIIGGLVNAGANRKILHTVLETFSRDI
jgi:GMP synthase-like glutamine amidotransferase